MKLWIARDKYGLELTNEKPVLNARKTTWLTSDNANYIHLDDEMFPEVTFEDSPMEVELKLVEEE